MGQFCNPLSPPVTSVTLPAPPRSGYCFSRLSKAFASAFPPKSRYPQANLEVGESGES